MPQPSFSVLISWHTEEEGKQNNKPISTYLNAWSQYIVLLVKQGSAWQDVMFRENGLRAKSTGFRSFPSPASDKQPDMIDSKRPLVKGIAK